MATVRELIEQLQKYPPDHTVVLSKDAEGNGFNEWYDIGVGLYDEDDQYGEGFSSWTYDDEDDPSTEREVTLDESNAICLWPV